MSSLPAATAFNKWLRQFVHEFAQLRKALTALSSQPSPVPPPFQVPKPFDSEGWERLCFGRLRAEEVQSGSPSQAGGLSLAASPGVAGQGVTPTASVYGQTATRRVGPGPLAESLLPLVLHMDQVVVGNLLARQVAELQTASSMQPFCAQWIYALGAILEKPVHADVSASLRALMKRVASMRAGLLQGPDDPQVPLLNVVAAVAGAYFGQDAELLGLLGTDADMP
ncbi:survival motor neuron interacting protein 1-domain-containing protein [Dunaliella salina]|uniref:Survival motor neuron interacting protein 1-domain-containing protein n=1 Tax=Dunaliella salina TaxID=3046 RepID=A0ABQ7GD14_DUNSA|nr:survival motor neuron interacting protein 1-domain-containing protein [Dunaliella salina]|eukprot:KAF5832507.1 survival motor neuron interacting protein 1-domain-containing protein [Dunaliella salina]